MKYRSLLEILYHITGWYLTYRMYEYGQEFGKGLHDYIAYNMTNRTLGDVINFTQYVQTYQQFSHGLDKLMSDIFGLIFSGLTFATYISLYLIWKLRHRG